MSAHKIVSKINTAVGTKAVTTKELSYTKDGVTMLVPKGSVVWIDVAKGVAVYGQDQFDIFVDEYTFLV